jgi:hypothetical protein
VANDSVNVTDPWGLQPPGYVPPGNQPGPGPPGGPVAPMPPPSIGAGVAGAAAVGPYWLAFLQMVNILPPPGYPVFVIPNWANNPPDETPCPTLRILP